MSDMFATTFFKGDEKIFPDKKYRTNTLDEGVDKEANFCVLKNTIIPAVLTENFFMTNKEEADLLLSEEGKDRIALAHCNAIREIEADI